MARPAIAVALPADEQRQVINELRDASFDAIAVHRPADLEALLAARRDIAVAILDGESDFDESLEYYSLLREGGRQIPALMVLSPRALDGLSGLSSGAVVEDEYFTRPYSVDSLRWRVEAMCIRSATVDDGSGPVIQTADVDLGEWQRRATIIAVFNPKGGVGKTTVATSLASSLQLRHGQKVLLVDADTVTGHVTTSLGLEQVRTVADSWRDELEGGSVESLIEIATPHPSGIFVVALTSSPLNTDILDPQRFSSALDVARRGFDYVVVDLHPSYSQLNQAIFQAVDRILVPVTPDVPALRAAVQLREVATEVGIADKLALIVNRANSGVSVADMERTVGMPALALVRSGGLLFVRASNAGRTVIEMFPRERISDDFNALAAQLIRPNATREASSAATAKAGFRIFGRAKDPVRA